MSPRDIPVLRTKLSDLINRFGLAADSHDGKAVAHVLDTFPRDELFQTSVEDLMVSIRGIVNLYERQQVRLFVRRDRFQRYYSCLLFVPRDRYNTQIRKRIESIMMESMNGTAVESQVQLSDSALARLHILIRSRAEERRAVDTAQLEQRIAEAVRTWSDHLRAALIAKYGEPTGIQISRQYANAFPAAYQSDTSVEYAVSDIEQLTPLLSGGDGIALRLITTTQPHWHLRLLRSGVPINLSDALPVLENLGLRALTERPYRISSGNERAVWIQDFELEAPTSAPSPRPSPRKGEGAERETSPVLGRVEDAFPMTLNVSLGRASANARKALAGVGQESPSTVAGAGEGESRVASLFRDAFLAIDSGRAESDGFNRLVLAAGLAWRPISVLRAYARYLLQTGLPFSQSYMEKTLAANPTIATDLWHLFAAQFDPDLPAAKRMQSTSSIQQRIVKQLDAVQAQDDDRILRAYLAAISASLRTNYYQLDAGEPKRYLSIKIDSQRIAELPLPKPFVEVFVYSPRVEGIHLRMGQVARGGIRWSDRREDFRTEVLGLMKAQNVKNTVIVPVGAKGGFVPKRLPTTGSNDDKQREGVACYRTFIRGLLDLTDNSVNGKIIPPPRVVRRDDDDPYLVVAADKGTATFSDIANSVAAEYKFWLGDAFASGGSVGYDHKKMAITARGAWECVRRHFREMNIDTQTQDFSVVGIGDMSGDVFGNGMLRSKHIRLLAAFDHRHIFIDPNPNATTSFVERERLFALPRSSWEDYNAKLISPGGGVFARSAKAIKLTAQIKTVIGVTEESLAPQALIRAILRMPVDLLWNGGIGAYVKASSETHSQAGDRTNDSVRVDGKDLRCKVVGEGGNLGVTQRGRIEYALNGGRINTDFIDNSAGVDCSDHEVNIKILLNAACEKGLKTAERNKLLVRMTNDVGALVLRDNYLQSQALSMMEFSAKDRLPEQAHFIRSLEITNELDRAVEYLPSVEDIADRGKQGLGLSRPEMAVLLSYSKIALFNRLIRTDVPEDPYLGQELERYFPAILHERYRTLMRKHRLRREIITTAITNSLVNRMGASFALRAQEDAGADAAIVSRAYTIARECIEARDLWVQIEALDNKVPAATQYGLMNDIARLLGFITYWLINRHRDALRIETRVAALRPGIRELRKDLKGLLSGDTLNDFLARQHGLVAEHIPSKLATQLAGVEALYSAPDIVEVAMEAKRSVTQVARVYFALDEMLSINWLRDQVQAMDVKDRWQSVARNTLRDNLYALHRTLCYQALTSGKEDAIAIWQARQSINLQHAVESLREMRALQQTDFATLSVAVQAIRKLT